MINSKIGFYWFDEWQKFIPVSIINQGVGSQELAAWLDNDIGDNLSSIDYVIDNFKEHISTNKTFAYSGNAHTCFFKEKHLLIECQYIENHAVLLSFDQIFYILEQYKKFVTSSCKYNDLAILPDPIDIEIISEGIEAINLFEQL